MYYLLLYDLTLRIVYIHEVNISFILFYTGFMLLPLTWNLIFPLAGTLAAKDQHLPNLDYAAVESVKRAKQIFQITIIAVSPYHN